MRRRRTRRYATRPGRRDDLIALFEREFIESQEACGMLPIGHYRDLDDPDRFVWYRGFRNMERRRRALEAFYVESAAWRNHHDAANATMIDSDNVLLLRPAAPGSGFDLRGLRRANAEEAPADGSFIGVRLFMLSARASTALVTAFEREVVPELEHHARRVAYFVTQEHPNDFPRLPVRESESALVATRPARGASATRLPAEVIGCEYLRLQPAARALFR